MKKFLSVLLTILTFISAAYSCTICAFAETTSKYWEPKHGFQDSKGYVNGEPADGISLMAVPGTEYCEITYSKEGTVTKWEFPTLTEGKDYTVISQSNNSITVLWTNEDQGAPYLNAIVDFGNGTAKQEAATKKITPKETTTKAEEASKNETITKKPEIAETISETVSNTDINNGTGNLTADKPVIISGIIAILLSSAIIAIFVKKKITRS